MTRNVTIHMTGHSQVYMVVTLSFLRAPCLFRMEYGVRKSFYMIGLILTVFGVGCSNEPDEPKALEAGRPESPRGDAPFKHGDKIEWSWTGEYGFSGRCSGYVDMNSVACQKDDPLGNGDNLSPDALSHAYPIRIQSCKTYLNGKEFTDLDKGGDEVCKAEDELTPLKTP